MLSLNLHVPLQVSNEPRLTPILSNLRPLVVLCQRVLVFPWTRRAAPLPSLGLGRFLPYSEIGVFVSYPYRRGFGFPWYALPARNTGSLPLLLLPRGRTRPFFWCWARCLHLAGICHLAEAQGGGLLHIFVTGSISSSWASKPKIDFPPGRHTAGTHTGALETPSPTPPLPPVEAPFDWLHPSPTWSYHPEC